MDDTPPVEREVTEAVDELLAARERLNEKILAAAARNVSKNRIAALVARVMSRPTLLRVFTRTEQGNRPRGGRRGRQ